MLKVLICSIFLTLVPNLGTADLKDYPHPIICKPIIQTLENWIEPPEVDWIILKWSTFVAIGEDKLLFKYDGWIAEVPMEGFSCSQ